MYVYLFRCVCVLVHVCMFFFMYRVYRCHYYYSSCLVLFVFYPCDVARVTKMGNPLKHLAKPRQEKELNLQTKNCPVHCQKCQNCMLGIFFSFSRDTYLFILLLARDEIRREARKLKKELQRDKQQKEEVKKQEGRPCH